MSVAQNIALLQKQVEECTVKSGRSPGSVTLIAVTKNFPAENAQACVDAGLLDLGENRVQELREKIPVVQGGRWHLIGHLQSNKVKYVVGQVALIHSLDSWSLAQEISQKSQAAGLVTSVLVQVNVAQETTKFGLAVQEVPDFVTEVAGLPGVSIEGLMTVAPLVQNPEEVRPVFRQLRELSLQLRAIPGVQMNQLSMGMSNDFQVAIEEGSTMVRVGTAIFGSRK